MQKKFIVLLSVVSVLLISSCSKSPAENMVGEWKITDIQTTDEIPEEQLEVYNEAIEGMKASSKMVYNSDGTFEKTISEMTVKGSWKISTDGKTLSEVLEDGTKESVQILEISATKLVTVSALDETKNTMTFEKVK